MTVLAQAAAALTEAPVVAPPAGAPRELGTLTEVAGGGGSRAIRLCPAAHGYPLLDWVVTPVAEVCDRAGVAVVLDYRTGPVAWADVVPFARAHPSVPMVVLGAEDARSAVLGPALDHTLNLLVGVDGRADPERLGHLLAVFGTSRFVWTGEREGPAELGEAVLRTNALTLADGTYRDRHL